MTRLLRQVSSFKLLQSQATSNDTLGLITLARPLVILIVINLRGATVLHCVSVFMCIIFRRRRAYIQRMRSWDRQSTQNRLKQSRSSQVFTHARKTIINSHLCARFGVWDHRFKKAIINYPKTWTCPVWHKFPAKRRSKKRIAFSRDDGERRMRMQW